MINYFMSILIYLISFVMGLQQRVRRDDAPAERACGQGNIKTQFDKESSQELYSRFMDCMLIWSIYHTIFIKSRQSICDSKAKIILFF